jgi:hypothetical protein
MADSLPMSMPASGPPAATSAEEFHVSEFAADLVGAMPPWGNIEFPMPIEKLNYVHPGPENRPHLAGT